MSDDLIKRAPDKVLSTHTDEDKIIAYLQGDTKRKRLSPKLQQKYDRYRHCSDLIRRYGSRLKVVPMMEKEYGISYAQASRDFVNTQRIFATTQETNQAFWVDILIGMILEDRAKAIKNEDFRAAATMLRTFKETIKELVGPADVIPYEKLIPPKMVVGFFPETLNVDNPDNLDELIESFKKKIKTNTVDIDAEDVEIED